MIFEKILLRDVELNNIPVITSHVLQLEDKEKLLLGRAAQPTKGLFMNEIDLIDIFYDELRAEGQSRETLYISLDESVVAILRQKLGIDVQLEDVHKFADICIANEWLERTTADPHYKYLSLTNEGLRVAIAYQYRSGRKVDHHSRKDDK